MPLGSITKKYWGPNALAKYIDRALTYPADDPNPNSSKIDIWYLFENVVFPAGCGGIASVSDDLDKEDLTKFHGYNERAVGKW